MLKLNSIDEVINDDPQFEMHVKFSEPSSLHSFLLANNDFVSLIDSQQDSAKLRTIAISEYIYKLYRQTTEPFISLFDIKRRLHKLNDSLSLTPDLKPIYIKKCITTAFEEISSIFTSYDSKQAEIFVELSHVAKDGKEWLFLHLDFYHKDECLNNILSKSNLGYYVELPSVLNLDRLETNDWLLYCLSESEKSVEIEDEDWLERFVLSALTSFYSGAVLFNDRYFVKFQVGASSMRDFLESLNNAKTRLWEVIA